MAQKNSPFPLSGDLKRVAERLAVESDRHLRHMIHWDQSRLEKVAGRRKMHMDSLDLVPGKVKAWAQNGAREGIFKVAAFLERNQDLDERHSPSYFPDPWLGVSESERGILGDKTTQALLFAAEGLQGRAQRDPELAARMADRNLAGDTGLWREGVTLDLAAEAVAAQHALDIRGLIASAPERARGSGFNQPMAGPDGLVAPPTRLYLGRMNSHTLTSISACSEETAKHLRGLDDRSLAYLAQATANPWSTGRFDPAASAREGCLERDRGNILNEGRDAAWRFGAEGRESDKKHRDRMWQELRDLDAQMAELPEVGRSDKLLGSESVSAVLHDATQQVLFDKSMARAEPSQQADVGSRIDPGAVGMDPF